MDVESVRGGLQSQPSHHIVIWAPPYPNFPKCGPNLHRYNSVSVHPYAHPQHMKVLEHFISNMDVGCSQRWFTASTMTPQCNLGSALPQFSKMWPSPAQIYSVRVHPYAHPQHVKVLKHFIYIQYGRGMQSVVVYSLNHDTTTSFGLRLTPIFQNVAPTCTGITV
jgi:hypothetical protein